MSNNPYKVPETNDFSIKYLQSAQELQAYSDIIQQNDNIIEAKLTGEELELLEEKRKNQRLVGEFKPVIEESVEPSKLLLLLETIKNINRKGAYVSNAQLKNLSLLQNKVKSGESVSMEEIKPFLAYLSDDIRQSILNNNQEITDETKNVLIYISNLQLKDLSQISEDELKTELSNLNQISASKMMDDDAQLKNTVSLLKKRIANMLHNKRGEKEKLERDQERLKNIVDAGKNESFESKLKKFANLYKNKQNSPSVKRKLKFDPSSFPSALIERGDKETFVESSPKKVISKMDTMPLMSKDPILNIPTPLLEKNEKKLTGLAGKARDTSIPSIPSIPPELLEDEEIEPSETPRRSKRIQDKPKGKGIMRYTISSDNKFGNIEINKDLLIKQNHLKAYQKHSHKKILDQKVPIDLVMLLTKRFNPKYKYSADSMQMYNQLLQKAKLADEHSVSYLKNKKVKKMNEPVVKVYDSQDDILQRVDVLVGMIEAGNKSIPVIEELSQLLDLLLRKKMISEEQYQQITDAYIL